MGALAFVVCNCTLEVEKKHFTERTVLAQANICMLDINSLGWELKDVPLL